MIYGRGFGPLDFQTNFNGTDRDLPSKGLAGDLEGVARLDSELGKCIVNFLPKDRDQFELSGYQIRSIGQTYVTVILNLYNPFYFKSSDQKYLDWLIYNVDFSAMFVKMSERIASLYWVARNSYGWGQSPEDHFLSARTVPSFFYLANLVKSNRDLKKQRIIY